MKSRIAIVFSFVTAVALTAGCSAGSSADDTAEGADNALTTVSADDVGKAQATDLGDLKFEMLTPTAEKLMRASHFWMGVQALDKRYPQPRMCASNVSKVEFLGGITRYDEEGVRALIADISKKGAEVFKMPQDKAGFLKKLATIHGGHIPAGTIIAGENVHTSAPGDQHVGFIGHEDDDGTVWAYHNNWYRPENEKGVRKPFMVSDENLKKGFLRQFMAVPWVKLKRDSSGNVTDVTYLIPGIDDMNPFNPEFAVTLAIQGEIVQELNGATTGDPIPASNVPVAADDGNAAK